MQQNPMDLMAFQKKFATERACRRHLFHLRCSSWLWETCSKAIPLASYFDCECQRQYLRRLPWYMLQTSR